MTSNIRRILLAQWAVDFRKGHLGLLCECRLAGYEPWEGGCLMLGFAFKSKTGKSKTRLQVTMATGRIHQSDQFSQSSLVRSHVGSFGNLLGKLIQQRDIALKNLVIQPDLSSSNLVQEEHEFCITYAGFLAHCRRPFWRYRDIDPLSCYQMLRGFALLSALEDLIEVNNGSHEVASRADSSYENANRKLPFS